ncbi:MAG TPA: tetratricopeptide repeat protein [Steroidobacteraceae bacterium]|nr:tetratricopeptide repeat protein [Steroidobacteraceae bacterium]
MSSTPIFARASIGLALAASAACAAIHPKPEESAPQSFYTVTAEIALARHQPRIAAVQYAAAAANETDVKLLERAAQVAAEALQPSLEQEVAARWMQVDPKSVEAQRAAARAALALYKVDQAAAHYRAVLTRSPIGADAEFTALESELGGNDNIFGARQVADALADSFPSSAAALRVQGFAALRADDPAAAVRSLTAALALPGAGDHGGDEGHRELLQTLGRAQIMAGDAEGPLARAQETLERQDTPANRLDYALLLMTAQRDSAASQQLEILTQNTDYAPVAVRLLGLVEFQEGHFEAATERFAQLLRAQRYLDDAFYYLGLIADRRNDPEQALRLYAQVQSGDNAVPALLRAAAILQKHGAPTAAGELLDRLVEDEPQRAPEILAARARMYVDLADYPQAIAVLERGEKEYPDSVDLRYAMASTYEDMGRVAAALHELTGLLDARPDDPAAMNALGYTLADHSRKLKRARKLIERAYAAAPKNAAILDSLGWVLFRQGHVAEAEPHLRAAYQDDRGGDIAAHLGEVLWQLGKPADAEHIWSEAGATDADNRLLKATRQRFHAMPPPPVPAQPAPAAPQTAPPPPPVFPLPKPSTIVY